MMKMVEKLFSFQEIGMLMNNLIISDTGESKPPLNKVLGDVNHDEDVIQMWLHGKSSKTILMYSRHIQRFLTYIDKGLREITLSDLQRFVDSLNNLSDNSCKVILCAVKSLLSFCNRMGYTTFNVGSALIIPKSRDTLNDRILSEEQVYQMLAGEKSIRNKIILRLLYSSGIRVSELCGLKWKDLSERNQGGQITVYGKGSKTRSILISSETMNILNEIRYKASPESSIFIGQRGGSLTSSAVWRIIRKAAKRVGITTNVSPHWLRHAHASHALDRGAPLHLVKDTLGHANISVTSQYTHSRPSDSSSRYLGL